VRDARAILDQESNTGGQAGYTMELYAYSAVDPYYTGSALYTYTDNEDGTYYADITTTIRGTLVITTPLLATVVPANFRGALFQGDNQLTLEPEAAAEEEEEDGGDGAVFDEDVFDGSVFG